MPYMLCFDFPEANGEPMFGYRGVEGWGLTMSLASAERFVTEAIAERTLANAYGQETRSWGAVVETEA
jgi:hypothetical protein